MRRFLVLLATVVLLVPLVPTPASAAEEPPVTFDGSGWGHGVGLSQYGAHGMAIDGASTAQILRHYYRGTDVVDQADSTAASFLDNPRPLWVGISQDRTSLRFRVAGGGADLCQAGDGDGPCPKPVRPEDGETWRFDALPDGSCQFVRVVPQSPLVVGSPGECVASVTPGPGTTLVLPSEGRSYDAGILRLRGLPGTGEFHVSLQLSVQDYLMGIAEMPTSWPAAALRAQVIAARSYAFAQASGRGPESSFSTWVKDRCWCHLYDDTRSQVYAGNVLSGSASWRDAVQATNRQVVAYRGTLVTAFYSSSSGGRTENVEDVWGGSPRPWLVSVDDSAAKDPRAGNPLASWSRERSRASVASAVGLDELDSAVTESRPSGGVESVSFRGTRDGVRTTVTRSGTWVRSTFGLPSHYFTIDVPTVRPASAYDVAVDQAAPIGWLDATKPTPEGIAVRGWALDPDTPLPILVHIYVDGRFAGGGLADDVRPDVERAFGNGAAHGFSSTIEAAPGDRRVCVYAINAPTRKGNPSIGCATVSVPGAAAPTPDPSPSEDSTPFGWVDTIRAVEGGADVRGWAIDRDDPDAPVGIHVYVDGRFAGGDRADERRPDVDRAHGLGTDHGFDFTVRAATGTRRVCVYAIDLPTKSDNPRLGCATITVP